MYYIRSLVLVFFIIKYKYIKLNNVYFIFILWNKIQDIAGIIILIEFIILYSLHYNKKY